MRSLRRAALVGALLALLAIGVRPHWTVVGSAGTAVLVTPGADAAATRRLADSLGGVPVVRDAAAVHRLASLRRLQVVGWGLDPETWHELDSIRVTLHPAAAPPGIHRISWPATIPLGADLVVEGQVTALPTGATVALTDPGGASDSAPLSDAGVFQLVAHPRALGPMLGILRVSIRDRPIAQETIGVTVVAPAALRLLILEASPRFETRALRDWLASHHGTVAIRSTISRDRYHTEFVNRDRVGLGVLTPRLMAQFDVVALDGRTLVGMTAGERATLRHAVTESGLGVLVEADTVASDSSIRFSDREFFLGFTLRAAGDLDERLVRPMWPGARQHATTALVAAPFTLADRFGTESLVDDGLGGAVAQVTPRGAGRVGVSLVRESARWIRSGERAAFGALWSRILTAVAAGHRSEEWDIQSPGPWRVNQPVDLSVDAAGGHPVVVLAAPSGARDSVFLARDPLVSTRWRGQFWPREPGWYHVESANGPSFYVQGAGAWRSHRSAELLDASARYLVGSGALENEPGRPEGQVSRPIPAGWFFGLFLVFAALLWSHRRAG